MIINIFWKIYYLIFNRIKLSLNCTVEGEYTPYKFNTDNKCKLLLNGKEPYYAIKAELEKVNPALTIFVAERVGYMTLELDTIAGHSVWFLKYTNTINFTLMDLNTFVRLKDFLKVLHQLLNSRRFRKELYLNKNISNQLFGDGISI